MKDTIYKIISIITFSLFMFSNGYIIRGNIEHSKRSPIPSLIVFGVSFILMIIVNFYRYRDYFKW